jgi:hypothetical protein
MAGAADISVGGVLGDYATTRVRQVLATAARALDARGTTEATGFADELRRRTDELFPLTATPAATPAAGTPESADAIWARVQAMSTAQFGQADAIMASLDASSRARDERPASSFSDAFSAFDMFG